VLASQSGDVQVIAQGKLASRYTGPDIEAMLAIAKAHSDRSLADFEEANQKFKAQLSDDPIIRNHLAALYDTLLEQNLVRVIEPYSKVEIAYVAEKVKLPIRDVESKCAHISPLGAKLMLV
jgi:26S proteasome regulatory subunit N6